METCLNSVAKEITESFINGNYSWVREEINKYVKSWKLYKAIIREIKENYSEKELKDFIEII